MPLSHDSHVQLIATLWAVICQAPLSMGFSRQKYWSGLSCPPPGDLPDPGLSLVSLVPPILAGRFFITRATIFMPILLSFLIILNQSCVQLSKFSTQLRRHDCKNAVILQVVGFLLEKGADITLCNYSNQTAVHVANCDVQRRLLAINGIQAPQMQLLQSSWQGDLEQLQHLLVS